MTIFQDAQGQTTLQSYIRFGQKFELIQASMVDLITCTNEVDPIKNLIGETLIFYMIYKVIFIQNPVFPQISVFKTKAECELQDQ